MDALQALSEPTRREIIELLVNSGKMSASTIFERFDATPPAISQHLKVLREANLVTTEKQAQQRIYRINPNAEDWIKKIMMLWNERFDRLESQLDS